MKTLLAVSALAIALGSAGCGNSNSSSGDPDYGPKAPIGNIKIDYYMPQRVRDNVATALNYVDSRNGFGTDSELSRVTGLTSLSSSSLHQWLEDRVQYILSPNYLTHNHPFYVGSSFSYDNPGVLPDIDGGSSDSNGPQLLMQNIGAGLYMIGKQNNRLVGMNIPGSGEVHLTSPRVGVIQIGGALVPDLGVTPPLWYYIFLAGVLFHESHHSDGNGKTLGFFHALCPSGRYKDYYACDRNLNGPYALEAILEKNLIRQCSECSVTDREKLNTLMVDDYSRILTTSTINGKSQPSTDWDPQSEGHR